MKNFKLNEEQFVFLMSNTFAEKDRYIKELNECIKKGENFEDLVNFYQRQIDKINSFCDEINKKFKTNF